MQVLYSDTSVHQPHSEIYLGEITPHQEVPQRQERILSALKNTHHKLSKVSELASEAELEGVHSGEYLRFLSDTCQALSEQYIYPSVFPCEGGTVKQNMPQVMQLGGYSFDMYTPISRNTWDIARQSAFIALESAKRVLETTDTYYALCRPPGHHAGVSQMGGYCYLNNSALAANEFSKYGKTTVVDVDFHHGNGTQSIFYERADVLTVSLHADPDWKYPFYTGRSEETGKGKGRCFNFNYPLPAKTTNMQFQETLETALVQVQKFGAEYLVIALGLDTHELDPIGGFLLTTEYYSEMAQTFNSLGIPTLIVQEGGYNNEVLGLHVAEFLRGFEK